MNCKFSVRAVLLIQAVSIELSEQIRTLILVNTSCHIWSMKFTSLCGHSCFRQLWFAINHEERDRARWPSLRNLVHDFVWSSSSWCWSAAEGGCLEALQWARENGCEWDWRTIFQAAENQHDDIFASPIGLHLRNRLTKWRRRCWRGWRYRRQRWTPEANRARARRAWSIPI